ncbi:MAG: hypothetical protein DME79_08375 [Verrucomicrobia bacterium]|nr:MAG: hypothetical protein DME79_08375 [Verrucomicrobiota bacterium]
MVTLRATLTSSLERSTAFVLKTPVADVYGRWLVFEDYSKFVTAIKRVRKLDANRFVASLGFNGKQYDTTTFASIVR